MRKRGEKMRSRYVSGWLFACILVGVLADAALATSPNAVGSGPRDAAVNTPDNSLRVIVDKAYSGHLVANAKGDIFFYKESGPDGGKFEKETLRIKGDTIYRKNSVSISRIGYGRQLYADMSLLDDMAEKVPNMGDKAKIQVPIKGMDNRYLSFTVRRTGDISMTSYLGPCSGNSIISLGGEVPKSVRFLSRDGETEAQIIVVSCGNNDCVSELEIVEGPLSSFISTALQEDGAY